MYNIGTQVKDVARTRRVLLCIAYRSNKKQRRKNARNKSNDLVLLVPIFHKLPTYV